MSDKVSFATSSNGSSENVTLQNFCEGAPSLAWCIGGEREATLGMWCAGSS